MHSDLVVCGTFTELRSAEMALEDLKREGLPETGISVLSQGAEPPSGPKTNPPLNTDEQQGYPVVAGVVGAVGGAAAAVAGVTVALASGGIALMAAGPIIATLAAGTVGATFGGAAGVVVGQGIPERHVSAIDEHLRSGKTLLLVHCENSGQRQTAERVLARTAENVSLLDAEPEN
jgi:hypothetical protein